MALANARQKLADVMGPLQIAEIQQKLKQMNQVQPAGIEKLPTGAISGVTFDPNTGTYSLQNLSPGAPPEPKFTTLQAAAAYYLQKGDFEKLKLVNDEIAKTKPPAKEEKPDTQIFGGYRWQYDPENKVQGPRDKTGQYVRLGIAKEPSGSTPPGDLDAISYDVATGKANMPTGNLGVLVANNMKKLGIEPPLKKPPKDIPPDVLAMLKSPVPVTPSPEESRRLADAADRIFGGTAYKEDLIKRGQRSPWMGLRDPYRAIAYPNEEYARIVGLLNNSITEDLSDVGGRPVQ
jgi:hypothetical protein